MKNVIPNFMAVCLMMAFVDVFGDWFQTGPYGGRISAAASIDNNIYVAGSRGLFLSTNGGQQWTVVNSEVSVASFAVIDTAIFAFANFPGRDKRIYRFSKNSNALVEVDSALQLNNNNGLNNITADGPDLFAIADHGFFVSKDKGVTWSHIMTQGIPTNSEGVYPEYAIAVSGSQWYVLAGSGVFYKDSSWSAWTQVKLRGNPITSNYNDIGIVVKGKDLYLSIYNGGLYHLIRNDTGWTSTDLTLPSSHPTGIFFVGNNILASTDNGLFISKDNDVSWVKVGGGLVSFLLDITVNGNSIIGGTYKGLFISTDTAKSWTALDMNGIACMEFYSVAAKDSIVCVDGGFNSLHGEASNDGGYRSVNYGNSWDTVLCMNRFSPLTFIGDYLFAGTWESAFFKSADNGKTWLPCSIGIKLQTVNSFLKKGNDFYIGTGNLFGRRNVLHSSNDGINWDSVNTGLPDSSFIQSLAFVDTNLFAAVNKDQWRGYGVYRFENNGKNWAPVNKGIPIASFFSDSGPLNINCFAVMEKTIFAGTERGVVYSADNGNNWTSKRFHIVNALLAYDKSLFAGTDSGVFLSTDYGNNWKPVSAGLPGHTNVHDLAMNATTLFAATEKSGLWHRSLSELAQVKHAPIQCAHAPPNIHILQSKGLCRFTFTAPDISQFRFSVYTLSGRQIASFTQAVKSIGGRKENFSLKGLPMGIYLYKFTAGTFGETGTFVMTK